MNLIYSYITADKRHQLLIDFLLKVMHEVTWLVAVIKHR